MIGNLVLTVKEGHWVELDILDGGTIEVVVSKTRRGEVKLLIRAEPDVTIINRTEKHKKYLEEQKRNGRDEDLLDRIFGRNHGK